MTYEVHTIIAPNDPVALFDYWTDADAFAEATSEMAGGVYYVTHKGLTVSKFVDGIKQEIDPGGGLF